MMNKPHRAVRLTQCSDTHRWWMMHCAYISIHSQDNNVLYRLAKTPRLLFWSPSTPPRNLSGCHSSASSPQICLSLQIIYLSIKITVKYVNYSPIISSEGQIYTLPFTHGNTIDNFPRLRFLRYPERNDIIVTSYTGNPAKNRMITECLLWGDK